MKLALAKDETCSRSRCFVLRVRHRKKTQPALPPRDRLAAQPPPSDCLAAYRAFLKGSTTTHKMHILEGNIGYPTLFINNLSDDPLLKTLGPNFRSYFYRGFHQFKSVFAEFKRSHRRTLRPLL
ncbi:unnamed protein product [Prunus armeniaca]